MDARRLPAAVLAAAADRQGGAAEVAARAVDGLLEVAADPPLLEQAVAVLEAGQPALAPIWHLARAAHGPDPAAALADLRRRLTTDADAAVAAATAWVLDHLADTPGPVATVSHSSLVDRVLARVEAQVETRVAADPRARPEARRRVPRWGSVAEPASRDPRSSTAPTDRVDPADATPVMGLVGPGAILNAAGTRELAGRLPTLVVATAIKLVPGEVFDRLAGPGFEVVPLQEVAAVVVGAEVLAPGDAGRRAEAVRGGRP